MGGGRISGGRGAGEMAGHAGWRLRSFSVRWQRLAVLQVVNDVFLRAEASGGPPRGGSGWWVAAALQCVEQARGQFCVKCGAPRRTHNFWIGFT
jgi:hypothetical protein